MRRRKIGRHQSQAEKHEETYNQPAQPLISISLAKYPVYWARHTWFPLVSRSGNTRTTYGDSFAEDVYISIYQFSLMTLFYSSLSSQRNAIDYSVRKHRKAEGKRPRLGCSGAPTSPHRTVAARGSAHTALQEPLRSVLSMHRSRAVLHVEEFQQHRSKDLRLDFVGLTFQGTMLAVGESLRQRYCCGIHEGE